MWWQSAPWEEYCLVARKKIYEKRSALRVAGDVNLEMVADGGTRMRESRPSSRSVTYGRLSIDAGAICRRTKDSHRFRKLLVLCHPLSFRLVLAVGM